MVILTSSEPSHQCGISRESLGRTQESFSWQSLLYGAVCYLYEVPPWWRGWQSVKDKARPKAWVRGDAEAVCLYGPQLIDERAGIPEI